MKQSALVLCVLGALALPAASSADGVGVARFEVVPSGQVAPDVGEHVAQRLATRGLGRVAGPSELGAPARFEVTPDEARGWAQAAGVDSIVVGRTTKVGSELAVHAKLLDGATGAAIGAPLVEEVPRPEDLGRTIDRLTGTLAARLAKRPGGPKAAPAAKDDSKERAAASFDKGQPLSVQSDQLDSQLDKDGRRHLVFTGHVRAVQGDLTLVSDVLEAFAAANASEPDRLVAHGHVTIKQLGRTARCAEATFFRDEQRVVCTGQLAEIEQECDLVRGPKITFHMGTQRLEVEGGADVQIRPDVPGCAPTAAAGGPGG